MMAPMIVQANVNNEPKHVTQAKHPSTPPAPSGFEMAITIVIITRIAMANL